jgi:hypothetical protein
MNGGIEDVFCYFMRESQAIRFCLTQYTHCKYPSESLLSESVPAVNALLQSSKPLPALPESRYHHAFNKFNTFSDFAAIPAASTSLEQEAQYQVVADDGLVPQLNTWSRRSSTSASAQSGRPLFGLGSDEEPAAANLKLGLRHSSRP